MGRKKIIREYVPKKMERYWGRHRWARPIVRIDPYPSTRKRYYLSILEAASELAWERDKNRKRHNVYWAKHADADSLCGNIRSGAELGYGMRYGYSWRFVTLAEAMAAGTDCI